MQFEYIRTDIPFEALDRSRSAVLDRNGTSPEGAQLAIYSLSDMLTCCYGGGKHRLGKFIYL